MKHRLRAIMAGFVLLFAVHGTWCTKARAQPTHFAGVDLDTLLDTPIRVMDAVVERTGAELLQLGTGMTLGQYEGREVVVTENGFSLAVTVQVPAGPITLMVEVSAPTRGTDSYYVEVDGVQLADHLVLPYQHLAEVSTTVDITSAGEHTFRLFHREGPGTSLRRFALGTFVIQSPVPPMRAELEGRHPRIWFTSDDLPRLRERLNDPVVQELYRIASVLTSDPPPFDPNGRNGGAFRSLGQYALGHLLEPNPEQLAGILNWLQMAVSYGEVGVDLDSEYFLEGLALTYDWIFDDIPEPLRTQVRDKIAAQCRVVFEASVNLNEYWGNSFEQNHYWYNNFALALGGAALYGEVPEAEEWLAWSLDRLERILLTFSPDGAFHEGPAYWDFSIPVLYMFVDMYEWLTGLAIPSGEDGFRGQAEFRFHHLFPGLELTAPVEDTTKDRGKPPVRLFLWEAKRFSDPVTMGMARLLSTGPSANHFHLLWLDETVEAEDATQTLPLGRYFFDVETAFARSSWDDNATHWVFVSRPLGGHKWADLCEEYGLGGTGHNHPAQNHFVLFGRGEVLAGDPGYTYEKTTRNHNTVLVDGQGQYGDGEMWPGPNPGRAHITMFVNEGDISIVGGDAASAYPEELNLTRFERYLVLAGQDLVVVHDTLSATQMHTFSWLLHHWADLTPDGENFVLTRNQARLTVAPIKPAGVASSTETYRPNYIHATRDLTPEEPDVNLLELSSGPTVDTAFLVALLVGDAGTQAPPVQDRSTEDYDAVQVEDTLVVFNRTVGEITVQLPWDETLTTDARVLVARLTDDGRQQVVLAPEGAVIKGKDDGCGCRLGSGPADLASFGLFLVVIGLVFVLRTRRLHRGASRDTSVPR